MIIIQRKSKTKDGIFGTLNYDTFNCVTCENLSKAIPAGVYDIYWEVSPHFQRLMPHIRVPNRTYIMIHNANFPIQLEGCIAVGDKVDGDAIDDSKDTFARFMQLVKDKKDLKVQVLD